MAESDLIIDAKIASAEARTDTKVAELRAEIRLANAETSAKLDKVLAAVQATNDRVASFEGKLNEQRSETKADFRAQRTLIIGSAISIAALLTGVLIAVSTAGNTGFTRGMSVRDVVKSVIAEQQQAVPTRTP